MKLKSFLSCLLSATLTLLTTTVMAAAPVWQIIPEQSTLTFSATQNGAPVNGTFQRFNGDIRFDPAELKSSHIDIQVDLAAIKTGDSTVADTLKSTDWFDTKLFPKAIFKASSFVLVSGKTYQANGTLTLRDKTQPVILEFTLETYDAHTARVKGKTTIKRSLFGVGQGDWSKTDAVKDDVLVEFVLAAKR